MKLDGYAADLGFCAFTVQRQKGNAGVEVHHRDESELILSFILVLTCADGSIIPALCFNLPIPPSSEERNPQYVSNLKEVANCLGLPPEYVSSIR